MSIAASSLSQGNEDGERNNGGDVEATSTSVGEDVVAVPWFDGTKREVQTFKVRAVAGIVATVAFVAVAHANRGLAGDEDPEFELPLTNGEPASDVHQSAPDLFTFLSEVPPSGYAFAFATVLGFGLMAFRVRTRREDRRTNRYVNGLKVTGIVVSWIAFMVAKTFTELWSNRAERGIVAGGQNDDGSTAAAKVLLGGLTVAGLASLVRRVFSRRSSAASASRRHRKRKHSRKK